MSIMKDIYFILFFAVIIFSYSSKCHYLKHQLIKQKKYFIKTLCHDFRVSVIAQIRGLDILQRNILHKKDETQLLIEINNSCKYTLDMVTMLTKIYKIETGELLLSNQILNPPQIVSEIFEELKCSALDKNINMKFCFSNTNIYADKESFTKALKIILYTAIQHAETESDINLSFNKNKNIIDIIVNYQGIPIRVKEKKHTLLNDSDFYTVGHDIEMHLCKKIIELHRGKMKFVSEFNNINSFKITIPA